MVLFIAPQGFGPEAKTQGGIIVSPAYTYKECVNIGVVLMRRINSDLMKLGAHGGQLASQCYLDNSCNHEHEEIEEDTICYTRRKYIFFYFKIYFRTSICHHSDFFKS